MRINFTFNELFQVSKGRQWMILYPLFGAIVIAAYLGLNLSISPKIGEGVWHGVIVKQNQSKPNLINICSEYGDLTVVENRISASLLNYPGFKSCMMTVMAHDPSLFVESLCINDEKCTNKAEVVFGKNTMSAEKTTVHAEY